MATKLSRQFFTAGKCTFTVKVPADFAGRNEGCNLHYTYKIIQSEPSQKYPKPAHFVKLLSGPDNTTDYKYLGILDPERGTVRVTERSCAGEKAWSVRIVRRVLDQIFNGEGMPAIIKAGWDVHHEGQCGRCGRPLTVPESIEVGIGPDCAEQMGIPYPTRTKAKKPRVEVVEAVKPLTAEQARFLNDPEAGEMEVIEGQYPQLPRDAGVWW